MLLLLTACGTNGGGEVSSQPDNGGEVSSQPNSGEENTAQPDNSEEVSDNSGQSSSQPVGSGGHVTPNHSEEPEPVDHFTEEAVKGLVDAYMTARYTALSTGDAAALREISGFGASDAERQHTLLNEAGVTVASSDYEILGVEAWEADGLRQGTVTLVERLVYRNGDNSEPVEIEHTLLLWVENGDLTVRRDQYTETYLGFASGGYVDDATVNYVVSIVKDYMEARYALLTSGDPADLGKTAVVPQVNDEVKHFELLRDAGLEVISSSISVTAVEDLGFEFRIYLVESLTYSDGSEVKSEEVQHILSLMPGETVRLVVASDEYREDYSGFRSASYVET